MATRPQPEAPGLSERAIHILEAAERCFVRHGFHRATMQDVAREAGMSPGNLYRYFPSKAAMVAGLIEGDRAEVSQRIEEIKAHEDFHAAFLQMGRSYLVDERVERIRLWVEIWAEATRNPDIATIIGRCDDYIREQFREMFLAAKARGQLPETFDHEAFQEFLLVVTDGLMLNRALGRISDPEYVLSQIDALFQAALRGDMTFPPRLDFRKNDRVETREEEIS